MKRSQLLAFSVLALLLASAVPLQQARAQSPYSEKLNVYVAGSDALWYFTFNGVNGSSHLTSLESTPGLSWYNITAISTIGWQSDFQMFGPQGYNLVPAPFLPSQGLFLTVGSDSYANASAAASALEPYLLTSFVSYSNGTGTYAFYSPLSFTTLVPATLLKLLPTADNGFASAISPSSFASTPSPFVVLEGAKSSGGFDHSLVVGSIATSALSTTNTLKLLNYFGGSVTSLAASNKSSSSTVVVRALDGLMQSSDKANVTTDTGAFTSTYALSISPGKRITGVNATVVEQPATLLATRSVDVGVLRTGNNIAVTLALTNLSPSLTITNITYADSWWNGTGSFKFLGGDDNLTSASLPPGSSSTPVYRLQYTGTGTGPLTIPASVVRYQYLVGTKTFQGETRLNPITLSQGVDEPVVYAILTPSGPIGKPLGSIQTMNITVFNVGTLPASSVVAAGKSIAGLAAKTGGSSGGSATVSVTQSADNLADANVTQSYGVTYQDPSGNTLQATTNVVSDVFSHSSMAIGFPTLTVGVNLSPISSTRTNLTLSFAAANFGLANVSSFSAVGTLPFGLGCGAAKGTGIACSGDRVTISYPVLNKSTTERTYMSYNLTGAASYILKPLTFQWAAPGQSATGTSNLAGVPAGVAITKTFAPSQLFGGMASTVAAVALNSGNLPFYNVTVTTTADSFDRLTSGTPLTQASASLAPGGNVTLSYPVSMSQTYGNLSATTVSATLYFGGSSFTLHSFSSRVQVYQPLSVSIVSSPATPEEGKSFTVTFEINNPSGVSVGNVLFTLPVPSGLTLNNLQNAVIASHVLTVSAGTLGPGANFTATASAVASSGITIPFSGSKLSFTYAGVTVSGVTPSSTGIAIAENVTVRYLIPIAAVVLVLLGVAFYMRRLASSAPASPK